MQISLKQPAFVTAPALFEGTAIVHVCVSYSQNEGQFDPHALPPGLLGASLKRRVEFLAGRCAARAAIESLTGPSAVGEVEIGAAGEPLWPAGLVGAITHTRGFAAAAVARACEHVAIGLDSEARIAPETAAEVAAAICRPAEQRAVDSARNPAELLTIVFSAKESLFKCLFARVGRYFDFQDAEVDVVDLARRRFSIRLTTSLTPDLPAGWATEGRFAMDDELVHTALWLSASAPNAARR